MSSIEEKEKWLKNLSTTSLIKYFDIKNCSENLLLVNNLAHIAAWASPVLDRIDVFFPSYTPHNFSCHVLNVLKTLEWLIKDKIHNVINNNELFCLIAACFTHDIGMAMSKKDINEVRRNPDYNNYKISILDRKIGSLNEENIIRQWVREMHHERSAILVLDFFKNVLNDEAYGLAVSRIVRGHGLDIGTIIKDNKNFPSEYTVGPGKIINIQALVAYLRLADILDCTKSRTPLALYDFINPEDPISKAEWNKHLSVLAVSPNRNKDKIIIAIDTDDPKIFINVKKFIEYLQDELNLCQTLLGYYSKEYSLSYKTIETNINSRGFEGVELYFKVNREVVLELLMGNNLYSNLSTCIRELLQNSVDACRQRAKTEVGYKPKIILRIYLNGDDLYLECKDNGIGMTTEIIEKFLLNVGNSYYESASYLNLYSTGKRIDPISKFGIGFLSCFILGDEILIETKNENEDAFSLEFQGVTNYIVKRYIKNKIKIGTTVKIKVSRSLDKDFRLIESVSSFIGLLEIPIQIIDELRKERKTLYNNIHSLIKDYRKTKKFLVTFNPKKNNGIGGYLAKIENYENSKDIISQQGFKIPLESILPEWIKNMQQLIDLSGNSKLTLTTSREKIVNDSKLEEIKEFISERFLSEFNNRFGNKKNELKELRYSWHILQSNIHFNQLLKENRDLEKFYDSLNIYGCLEDKLVVKSINDLIGSNLYVEILPYKLEKDIKDILKIYNPEDIFVCNALDINYGEKIHDFLKNSLKAVGMAFWIPELKVHSWRYKVNDSSFGYYSYESGSYDSSFPTGFAVDFEVSYSVEGPDIYFGVCQSPFLLFRCPFDNFSLFLNTKLIEKGSSKSIVNTISSEVEDLALNSIFTPKEGSGYIEYDTIKIYTLQVVDIIIQVLKKVRIYSEGSIEPDLLREYQQSFH